MNYKELNEEARSYAWTVTPVARVQGAKLVVALNAAVNDVAVLEIEKAELLIALKKIVHREWIRVDEEGLPCATVSYVLASRAIEEHTQEDVKE